MFVATAVLSGLLVFVFGAGAIGKLARAKPELEKSERLDIRWSRYRWIALAEAAAAVGLLVGLRLAPLGMAAAIGLVVLMAGAVGFRVRVRDAVPLIAGDAVVMVVAAATAVLRALSS